MWFPAKFILRLDVRVECAGSCFAPSAINGLRDGVVDARFRCEHLNHSWNEYTIRGGPGSAGERRVLAGHSCIQAGDPIRKIPKLKRRLLVAVPRIQLRSVWRRMLSENVGSS